MNWNSDLSARTRLRALRDFSQAYGHVRSLAETHKNLAHISLVLFANGRWGALRLRRCLKLLLARRNLIIDTMSEPCSQGYSGAVMCIMEVDQMIFNLRSRCDVAAAAEAVQSVLCK